MTTVILLFGYPGSGKTTALDAADNHNVPHIVMGDIVRSRAHDYHDAAPGTLPGSKIGEYATNMREQHGDQVMAEYTLLELTDADSLDALENISLPELVVVEGVRGTAERTVFSEHFDTVVSVFVEVKQDIRYDRMLDRGRDDDEAGLEKLKKRDEREEAWGLKELAESEHDHRITNNGSKAEFTDKFEQVLLQHTP